MGDDVLASLEKDFLELGLEGEGKKEDLDAWEGFWEPLLMSTVAGLSTTVGGLMIFWLESSKITHKLLAMSLAAASSTMITVSVFDILLPAVRSEGFFMATSTALFGALCFEVIARMLPDPQKFYLPTNNKKAESKEKEAPSSRVRQLRLGFLMMLTLTLHNFPEGLATSCASLASNRNKEKPRLGFVVTLAIALHNFPEGLCIALPVFSATRRRDFAIALATISGLTEPLGALVALTFFKSTFKNKPWMVEAVLCFVSGVMVAVCFRELIPEALGYKEPRSFVLGTWLGFLIMFVTIQLLG